jgi:hypothetical protein
VSSCTLGNKGNIDGEALLASGRSGPIRMSAPYSCDLMLVSPSCSLPTALTLEHFVVVSAALTASLADSWDL